MRAATTLTIAMIITTSVSLYAHAENQTQATNLASTVRVAILNTSDADIESLLLNQAQDAIADTNEAMVFVKNNASNILIADFSAVYSEAMKKSKLQMFEKSIKEHGGKSLLLASASQYLNYDNDCEFAASDYSNGLGQFYKKVSVTCMPTIYGSKHWIPVTQKITDTYYISSFGGTPSVEQMEFGLLSKHKQNIATLLKNIKDGINEQFI